MNCSSRITLPQPVSHTPEDSHVLSVPETRPLESGCFLLLKSLQMEKSGVVGGAGKRRKRHLPSSQTHGHPPHTPSRIPKNDGEGTCLAVQWLTPHFRRRRCGFDPWGTKIPYATPSNQRGKKKQPERTMRQKKGLHRRCELSLWWQSF